MMRTDLISDEHCDMNVALHKDFTFGGNSAKAWSKARLIIDEYNCKSVLDYGCGKGRLRIQARRKNCEIAWQDYDPAVLNFSTLPYSSDLVIVRDVMEHVEPNKLNAILEHIAWLSNRVVWFTIPNSKSTKTLANGQNAHLIQENSDWWKERISKYFDIVDLTPGKTIFNGICTPLEKEIE